MKFDISHVAKLANLPISNSEGNSLQKQLEETLEFIDSLNEIDTKNIEPTSAVTGLENVIREDETSPSLSQEQALKNAKSIHNGFFRVKGILSNE